jgi:hypothetical protein
MSSKLAWEKHFYTDLKRQFSSIKQNPFARAVRYDDIRFALLDDFLMPHILILRASKLLFMECYLHIRIPIHIGLENNKNRGACFAFD